MSIQAQLRNLGMDSGNRVAYQAADFIDRLTYGLDWALTELEQGGQPDEETQAGITNCKKLLNQIHER